MCDKNVTCKRDSEARDRDETETFDFQSETRPRPRRSHISTRPRWDRDVGKMRLETVSRPRRRDRDHIPACHYWCLSYLLYSIQLQYHLFADNIHLYDHCPVSSDVSDLINHLSACFKDLAICLMHPIVFSWTPPILSLFVLALPLLCQKYHSSTALSLYAALLSNAPAQSATWVSILILKWKWMSVRSRAVATTVSGSCFSSIISSVKHWSRCLTIVIRFLLIFQLQP